MIVAITGGRDYEDKDYLYHVLDDINDARNIKILRTGGMTGADALAARWAYERKVDTECYGAKWGSFGSAAGPRRNRVMLMGGEPGQWGHAAELLVAFAGGRGTASTIRIADEMAIPVVMAADYR